MIDALKPIAILLIVVAAMVMLVGFAVTDVKHRQAQIQNTKATEGWVSRGNHIETCVIEVNGQDVLLVERSGNIAVTALTKRETDAKE